MLLPLVACKRKEEITFSQPPPTLDAAPPPIASVDPQAAARADEQKTLAAHGRAWLTDLQFLIANKTTMSPKLVSGDGDATAICDAAAAVRPKAVDPEAVAVHQEIAQLCAFDVPLLIANESLDQLRSSTSQASVRLMCSISAREIAKARAVKPSDPKVHAAERRRIAIGRCQ